MVSVVFNISILLLPMSFYLLSISYQNNIKRISKHLLSITLIIQVILFIFLKDYTKSLIYEDTALARQIEEYIQRRDTAEQQKRDREEAKGNGLDEVQLTDEDFQELNEFNLTNLEQDAKIYDADGRGIVSLQSILDLSIAHDTTKQGLSEERLAAQLQPLRTIISFYREYPDLLVDMMKGPDSTFRFYFYQRIFIRIVMRHRKVYATFPRA